MSAPHDAKRSRIGAVLRDVQFWIPVIVLIGGLMVLQWIR